jgi:hypothetical protein
MDKRFNTLLRQDGVVEQPFNVGDKVRASLGTSGVVEVVDMDKDGQIGVKIRWKSGALGTYMKEDIKRYEIKKG